MNEMKNMSYDEMIEELEQYYEAAGFDGYYEKELKDKPESEIRKMYQETFGDLDMSGAD